MLIALVERVPKRSSIFTVTDFVGMTHDDIVQAFKRWGDKRAAKRGTTRLTLGGHGNGGKFYMRQSFGESRFVTYKEGVLNVFGFNTERKYGFMQGYENKEMDLQDALDFAGIDVDALPDEARKRLGESAGFTVVIGEHPKHFKGPASTGSIIEKLVDHPQARRLIAHKLVFVRYGKSLGDYIRLEVADPDPRPNFETDERYDVPLTLTDEDGDEQIYRDARWPDACLVLSTSSESLRFRGADRIDFTGEVGVIGSYQSHELRGLLKHPAHAEFIYGECYVPKLEDPEDDCVKNDREKLVDNLKSRALLKWVREKVDELAARIAESEARERRAADLSQSSAFNELLNQWKNKFMPTLMAELFGGLGEGSGFGGTGLGVGGADGDIPVVGGKENKTDTDHGGGDEGGGGDEKKVGRRAPTVLLSGFDADPLDPLGGTVDCSPRHPGVYQRREDYEQGIYWINTSRPISQRILDEYTSQSTRWRDYMFQRYMEIILKQSIRELERKQGRLDADLIDSHIDELYMRIYDQADKDLGRFLFDEKLVA